MEMAQDNASLARTKSFLTATWKINSKICDYCKSATAILYCREDSAFMCLLCDTKSHNESYPTHERVLICEVCEQAPAVVTCKADAATLCESCDRDIHSVNPLARRHVRVPVIPFYDTAELILTKSTGPTMFMTDPTTPSEHEISDSWISGNSKFSEDVGLKSVEFLVSETDHFLDFEACQVPDQTYNDSIVPVVHTTFKPQPGYGSVALNHDHLWDNQFEIEFMKANVCSFNKNYITPSLRHSVSSTLLDVGVVPDGGSLSDKTYLFTRNMVEPDGKQGTGVVGMDRVARVLRYREKRKNRKFEKTIRYASRKAYAESRPRIKGRFAKRTDSETDLNQLLPSGSSRFALDAGYGVVPSF